MDYGTPCILRVPIILCKVCMLMIIHICVVYIHALFILKFDIFQQPVYELIAFPFCLVVAQAYVVDVFKATVMLHNDALLACVVPSHVADQVDVVGWVDSLGNQLKKNQGNLIVFLFYLIMYVLIKSKFDTKNRKYTYS